MAQRPGAWEAAMQAFDHPHTDARRHGAELALTAMAETPGLVATLVAALRSALVG